MQKARVLVLDVIGGNGLYEAEVESLNDYYEHLKCDCFDIANRKVGDKRFDIFVDDVGLFVDKPIPSVLDRDLQPMLVGNCIFANHDYEGNTTSLSDEDIEMIKREAISVVNIDTEVDQWTVIVADY